MRNRLKTMRKAKGRTQQEVADFIGISQNAYSYWENGKVRIDNESLARLADFFGVSLDFLSGLPYEITRPISQWHVSLQEEYHRGDTYLKEYLEYKYGKPIFKNDDNQDLGARPSEEDIVIYHYNGKIGKKKLTKEQMAIVYAMLEAMPDTPTDF